MNNEFKRMQELAGLTEIKINQPNPLNYLLNLQSKIKATEDPLEKLSLAIQSAEKVLFIWEEKYPDDKRPRKAIEAAKAYLANPTEDNGKASYVAAVDADEAGDDDWFNDLLSDNDNATSNAAYAASSTAYINARGSDFERAAAFAVTCAIKAAKIHYNLNEIKVNEPFRQFIPLKLPFDSSGNTNVTIPNDNFEGEYGYGDLINNLVELNPQIDPYFFQVNNDGLYEDVLDSIFENNPEGTTLIEFYKIYFHWLFRNLVADYNRYEDNDMNRRYDEFDQYKNEFVENAMKGKWLNIKTVTAK
jgi:hypothetical protein